MFIGTQVIGNSVQSSMTNIYHLKSYIYFTSDDITKTPKVENMFSLPGLGYPSDYGYASIQSGYDDYYDDTPGYLSILVIFTNVRSENF